MLCEKEITSRLNCQLSLHIHYVIFVAYCNLFKIASRLGSVVSAIGLALPIVVQTVNYKRVCAPGAGAHTSVLAHISSCTRRGAVLAILAQAWHPIVWGISRLSIRVARCQWRCAAWV